MRASFVEKFFPGAVFFLFAFYFQIPAFFPDLQLIYLAVFVGSVGMLLLTSKQGIRGCLIVGLMSFPSLLVYPRLFLLIQFLYFGFYLFKNKFNHVKSSIIFVVWVNFFFMISQIMGIFPVLAEFQNYHDGEPVNLLFDNIPPYLSNEQYRPSGIFPSTIYLSQYMIFMFTIFLIAGVDFKKRTLLPLSLTFAVAGSTTSHMILVISILLLIRSKLILQFNLYSSFFLLLTLISFPEAIIVSNYNYETFFTSIDHRLPFLMYFLELRSLADFFFIFSILALVIPFCYVILIRFKEFALASLYIFLIGLPVVIHPLHEAMMYYFQVGCCLGFLYRSEITRQLYLIPSKFVEKQNRVTI